MAIQYLNEAAKLERKLNLQEQRLQQSVEMLSDLEKAHADDRILTPLRAKIKRHQEAMTVTQVTLNIVKGLADRPTKTK